MALDLVRFALVRSRLVLRTLLVLLAGAACRAGDAPSTRLIDPEKVGLSSEKLQGVHALLEENVRKGAIAGAVALVAREGKIAYLDPVGLQDVESGRPMAPDTIFRICSMTKPVTSVAALYTYFWIDPRKDLIGIVMAQLHPWDGRTLWDDFRKRVYEAVLR